MATYYDMLNDLRWKKKRKRILKRDGYKCTVCGSNKDLCVHHTFYYSDRRPPWNYPDESLLTACAICHVNFHIHSETEIREHKKVKSKNKRIRKKKRDILSELQRSKKTRLIKGMSRK